MACSAHWSLKLVKTGRVLALVGAACATVAALATSRDPMSDAADEARRGAPVITVADTAPAD